MLDKRIFLIIVTASLLLLSSLSAAEPPLPFTAYYDARFQGFKADAEISLTQLDATEYLANSTIKIRLFGAAVSTIRESSHFEWLNDRPQPYQYEYSQSGLGGRSRSVNFDWQNNLAVARVKNESIELSLAGSTLDELSMYSFIKQEINRGNNDIIFSVVNRNKIEEYRYQTIGEEEVITESGVFSAIKVERIRENSSRLTQLWFATNHDMLLIKLFQRDPDGDEFEITLSSAQVNGEIVSPN